MERELGLASRVKENRLWRHKPSTSKCDVTKTINPISLKIVQYHCVVFIYIITVLGA
jgi:hypothetical protein